MQTNFVCACSACHPNLNKGLKPKLQIVRNKYKQCCLNLNNRAHIDQNKFEEINYSPGNDRFEQLVSSISFKIWNNTSPRYMNDVFKPAGEPDTTTRTSLLKLNQPLQKTNHGKKSIF